MPAVRAFSSILSVLGDSAPVKGIWAGPDINGALGPVEKTAPEQCSLVGPSPPLPVLLARAVPPTRALVKPPANPKADDPEASDLEAADPARAGTGPNPARPDPAGPNDPAGAEADDPARAEADNPAGAEADNPAGAEADDPAGAEADDPARAEADDPAKAGRPGNWSIILTLGVLLARPFFNFLTFGFLGAVTVTLFTFRRQGCHQNTVL